jgi:hypothetical protein
MDIKKAVTNFKNLFDWTPVAVTEPVPDYYEYGDIGKQFIGYNVVVTYKHHGVKTYSFSCDTDKLGFADREWAKRRADKFYAKMQKQVAKGR